MDAFISVIVFFVTAYENKALIGVLRCNGATNVSPPSPYVNVVYCSCFPGSPREKAAGCVIVGWYHLTTFQPRLCFLLISYETKAVSVIEKGRPFKASCKTDAKPISLLTISYVVFSVCIARGPGCV
jgi:hypothetical protein